MSDVWYDDFFKVLKETLWKSESRKGEKLVTALTKEECISATRFYLKGRQEGWDDSRVLNDGKVGGKL